MKDQRRGVQGATRTRFPLAGEKTSRVQQRSCHGAAPSTWEVVLGGAEA